MRLSDYARHLCALGGLVYSWLGQLSELDGVQRDKAALYAEEVAATLLRAALALRNLETHPHSQAALLDAARELGRISGYVETIVDALDRHLDGRKRARVKRRLEHLAPFDLETAMRDAGAFRHAKRLVSAEGFFRALADALRV